MSGNGDVVLSTAWARDCIELTLSGDAGMSGRGFNSRCTTTRAELICASERRIANLTRRRHRVPPFVGMAPILADLIGRMNRRFHRCVRAAKRPLIRGSFPQLDRLRYSFSILRWCYHPVRLASMRMAKSLSYGQ
jgi:hypothetical protein